MIASGKLEFGTYHVPEIAATNHACFWDPAKITWLTLETQQVMAGLYKLNTAMKGKFNLVEAGTRGCWPQDIMEHVEITCWKKLV